MFSSQRSTVLVALTLGLALLAGGTSGAQETTETPPATGAIEDPAHNKLRELRDQLTEHVNQQQWAPLTEMLSEKVVVTWLDGTQSHGRTEVLDYLNEKTGGESPLVEKFTLSVDVAELSDLFGDDAATAYGTAKSAFVLRGKELVIEGPWTATMVREGDAWKIASAHASLGAFDNPLLTWAGRMIWIAGGVAALVGLAIGWWLGGRRANAVKPAHAE